jgi:hypothetical protein
MMKGIGFQAVDMHFHTEYSMDAVSEIKSVLKKCKKRGYGVAVTDHNEVAGALKAWKHRGDVFVIPGMEASTQEGAHALYYFYDIHDCLRFYTQVVKPLKKKNPFFLPISIDGLMEKARGYNAVIATAHPYGVGKIGIKKVHLKAKMRAVEKWFQLSEGLNGANLRSLNKRAITWGKLIRKGMTAGSDGHMTRELGNSLTLAYGYDVESYLGNVKKGHAMLLGREQNLFLTALRQIKKEKDYFKSARKLGLGMFWMKEHAGELEKLREKFKNSDLFRKQLTLHTIGVGKEDYKHYLDLGFNGGASEE